MLKKSKKRFISLLMVVAMIMTMIPFSAFANETTASDNKNTTNSDNTQLGTTFEATDSATLETALKQATDGDIITLSSDISLDAQDSGKDELNPHFTITKDITLNLNNHTISWNASSYSKEFKSTLLFFSIDAANVTITGNGKIDTEAAYNNSFGIDIINDGNLIIENGTFTGATTAVQVTKGTLTVLDGNFIQASTIGAVAPNYAKYVVNCIDSAWKNGTAKIYLKGGTYCFNPTNPEASAPFSYVDKDSICTENGVGQWLIKPAVAKIGEQNYSSLVEAVAAANADSTIILQQDYTGGGIGTYVNPGEDVNSNPQIGVKNFTLDLNGHTYTVNTPAVGSDGYETQAFHLEKGASVTIKNGTLTSTGDSVKMLMQNYCDLTLDHVTLDGTKLPSSSSPYTLSNNHGTVIIKDSTILAAEGGCAFDLYYWPKEGYTDGISVTVEGNSKICGRIEYGTDGSDTATQDVNKKAILVIKNGQFNSDFLTYQLGNNQANINITGGTFSANPSNYVADGYKVRTLSDGTYKVIDADVYTITFDANGGSCDTSTADTNGDGILTTLPTATRDGYTFDGWFTAKDGGEQVKEDYVFSADTTLYAHWTKISSGGGSTVIPTPDPEEPSDSEETVTNPDGSTTTTITKEDGSSSTTTVGTDGKVESEVTVSKDAVNNADGSAVTLPIPEVAATSDKDTAATVTVNLPSKDATKVEVPVKDVTPGTVAVLVDADGNETVIKDTVQSDNGITVEVTDGATIKVVDNSKSFNDVADNYWGADAIDFATSRELFAGTAENTFSPEGDMTRAMIWSVLARYEGADIPGGTGDTWYDGPQKWAIENGISDGTYPNASMTREQLAAMLYRYVGSPAVSGIVGDYSDADSISSWASDAMVWAVQEGLLTGMDENTLNPQGTATRTQVAAILQRFIENKMA